MKENTRKEAVKDRAADGKKLSTALDVVRAVGAKTGETPHPGKNRTSPELALPADCPPLQLFTKAILKPQLSQNKRTPPSSVTKEYH